MTKINRKITWKHLLSRRWTILRCELFTKGYVEPLKNYIGVPNRDLLVTKEDEKCSLYNSVSSLKEISLALIDKLKSDKDFGEKIYNDCVKSCENLVAVSREVSDGNLSSLSAKEIEKRLNSYVKAALDFTPFLALPNNYEMYITGEIKGFLASKIKNNEIESCLQKLMTPKQFPFQVLEQIELAKIALMIKNRGKVSVTNELREHAQKYKWLSCYNFDEEGFSANDFMERVQVLEKLPLSELKAKTEDTVNKLQKDDEVFKETVKKLGLKGEILSKVNLLREFVFLRTYRIEMNSKSNFYVKPLLNEIAKRSGITIEELCLMVSEEIKELIQTSKVPKTLDFKERRKYAVFWLDNCKYYAAFGKEAKKLNTKFISITEKEKKVSKIKGTPASLGETVKGKVRVITKKNMAEFKRGEVLVTTMTSPEFVPAMHKSVAIVTDEGGVLCHAAIVSREMKKPCIIGTKVATKQLSDGDLVEVNTKEGYIKIL